MGPVLSFTVFSFRLDIFPPILITGEHALPFAAGPGQPALPSCCWASHAMSFHGLNSSLWSKQSSGPGLNLWSVSGHRMGGQEEPGLEDGLDWWEGALRVCGGRSDPKPKVRSWGRVGEKGLGLRSREQSCSDAIRQDWNPAQRYRFSIQAGTRKRGQFPEKNSFIDVHTRMDYDIAPGLALNTSPAEGI